MANTINMTAEDREAWMSQWAANLRAMVEKDPHVMGSLARLEIARLSMGEEKFGAFMRETFAHYLVNQDGLT
jgi:hypothetical protein